MICSVFSLPTLAVCDYNNHYAADCMYMHMLTKVTLGIS